MTEAEVMAEYGASLRFTTAPGVFLALRRKLPWRVRLLPDGSAEREWRVADIEALLASDVERRLK